MAEYPFLYLLSTYLPDPSGTLTLNLKLHATPIKSKKNTSKCTLHFRLGFKTRDLIGYWYYLMSAMQIVANEIARFKSRFGKTEVQGTF